MALNISFIGNIYNKDGNIYTGNDVRYQLYFHKINSLSSNSIWSSTRLSEYGQYNINLGDGDILTQDGVQHNGDNVIIAFWTPNTSIKTDNNLIEWGFIDITLDGSSYYNYDVKLQGPLTPECNFSISGSINVNENVVLTDVSSNNLQEWEFGTITIYQEPTKYGQPIFYSMNTLPSDSIDISWGDGTFSNNQTPATTYNHEYTIPNDYTITVTVNNISELTDIDMFMWSIYYADPVINFNANTFSPLPSGISNLGENVTFTNTTTDPNGRSSIDGWHYNWSIEDLTYSVEYTNVLSSYSPEHQFHSSGEHSVSLTLFWYNGHEWLEKNIVRQINQLEWDVTNGLTWGEIPVYVHVEYIYTPTITGDTGYVDKVNYLIDGSISYSNLSVIQWFKYIFHYSDTHHIKQDVYYQSGFGQKVKTFTFTIEMSPISDFVVSDDVCGYVYTSTGEPGKQPITYYKWIVYLNNMEIATLEGSTKSTFRYNWPTIGNFKIRHEITDSSEQTAFVLKNYDITSCRGGTSSSSDGYYAGGGGGVVAVEKPLPKINVKLEKEINKNINVFVKLYGGITMIQLKSDEEKTLLFDIIIEGIGKDSLTFMFRLDINGVEYGFPGMLENEKVKVYIPALENVLKEDSAIGMYKGKLEVMGDNKYYMKPWSDDVEIKMEPKVVANVEKSQEYVQENIKIRAFISSSPLSEVVKKETGIKNSKLRNELK
jgi:hypothetical protein